MATAIRLANGESTDTPKWHKRRMMALAQERQPMLQVWEEQQRYIAPRLNRRFMPKDKRSPVADMSQIIDTTATHALGNAASGMQTAITSPARRWMKLVNRPLPGGGDPPSDWIDWFQHAEDSMFSFWDRTDLYGMLSTFYPEYALFCTAAAMGTPAYAQGEQEFIWRNILAGDYMIAENETGMVDTLYRTLELTVDQLVSRYVPLGRDGRPDFKAHGPGTTGHVSERVAQRWRDGHWDESVKLVQGFTPNPFVERYMGVDSARTQEIVFELDGTEVPDDREGNFLSRQMFQLQPFFVARWEHTGISPWGTGPGMEVLPDVKQLQEMEDKKGTALTLQLNPPLQGPPSLQNARVSSLPGDVTFTDMANGKGLSPIYEVKPDLKGYLEDMEMVRARIRRSFHADLFRAFLERPGIQPLNESEIFERKEEKLLGLGQVMDRLDREAISPIVEISLDHLLATGQLDDPPEGLEEIDIEYLNIISVAQRTQGLTAIAEVMQFVSTTAQQQVNSGLEPTAWDRINVDEGVKMFVRKRGADMRILMDDDEVEEIQEQRAQVKAQQAQLAAQEQAAKAAKDQAAADELSQRTQQDQGPLATGAGPGNLPPESGAIL